MRFFVLVFFHGSTPYRPLMNVKKLFRISREFGDIFVHKIGLSTDYPQKVGTFRELFCVKGDFSAVNSVECFDFPRIILRKGMPFRRIIRGNSKRSANYPAESFIIIPRKVKTSLFKGLSLFLKLILDKNSTTGDQYYPRFRRKNGKMWDN
jgi:hypothetical protein